LDGALDILGAILLLALTSLPLSLWLGSIIGAAGVNLILFIAYAFSIALVVLATMSFVLAYGLWKGYGWAWRWALISAIVGLASSVLGIGLGVGMAGIAVNALIIFYLTRIEVKAFFGKASPLELMRLSSLPSASGRFCSSCGNPLNSKDAYCSSCGSRRFG
jgi:uncharacterized membrane protein (DUF2068 family)